VGRFDCPDFWLHRLHERFDDFVGGAPTPQMMAIQWRETDERLRPRSKAGIDARAVDV
jgi:hypothetical protein